MTTRHEKLRNREPPQSVANGLIVLGLILNFVATAVVGILMFCYIQDVKRKDAIERERRQIMIDALKGKLP